MLRLGLLFMMACATGLFDQLCTAFADGKKVDYPPLGAKWVTGKVLAATDSSILIAEVEGKKRVIAFPLHDRLSSGDFNHKGGDSFSYRIKDVCVGDLIDVHVEVIDKIDYCVSISICSRPEGSVPSSQQPDEFHPYHERRNANDAWVAKKIPVPRFLTTIAREWEYPFADPAIPKTKRLARFPYDNPFSYMEWVMFMR